MQRDALLSNETYLSMLSLNHNVRPRSILIMFIVGYSNYFGVTSNK